ncbi:MAG: hypothetical protein KGJ86_04575 [Chloroflexota bacterium]|nr:hypothetical protein [Chloroflexota bacterium]
MTEHRVGLRELNGRVVAVDHDHDTITVRLDDGEEEIFPFEPFDSGDVFRVGQRFSLISDQSGKTLTVVPATEAEPKTVPGYVESVDADDELVWVYLRDEEGWHRKVMPLELFAAQGLAHAGRHFRLEMDDHGTPVRLSPDEQELEMQAQPAEETKPRWTNRPAAEAE